MLVALLAMLALLVQALIPAAAMAHDARSGQTIVICTTDGAKTIAVKTDDTRPAKGFAGFSCAKCVAVSLATLTPEPACAVAPVRYAVRLEVAVVRRLGVRGHARAPPRPPGQGPPALLNV